MAVRGAIAKEQIMSKIREVFPDAFLVGGKELRIPMSENGEIVQIKVALTAAKDNVEPDGGSALVIKTAPSNTTANIPTNAEVKEPSDEEKANIAKFLAAMGV